MQIEVKPANGSVTVNEDNTVVYKQDGSLVGTDAFYYSISDVNGNRSNMATVELTIKPESADQPVMDSLEQVGYWLIPEITGVDCHHSVYFRIKYRLHGDGSTTAEVVDTEFEPQAWQKFLIEVETLPSKVDHHSDYLFVPGELHISGIANRFVRHDYDQDKLDTVGPGLTIPRTTQKIHAMFKMPDWATLLEELKPGEPTQRSFSGVAYSQTQPYAHMRYGLEVKHENQDWIEVIHCCQKWGQAEAGRPCEYDALYIGDLVRKRGESSANTCVPLQLSKAWIRLYSGQLEIVGNEAPGDVSRVKLTGNQVSISAVAHGADSLTVHTECAQTEAIGNPINEFDIQQEGVRKECFSVDRGEIRVTTFGGRSRTLTPADGKVCLLSCAYWDDEQSKDVLFTLTGDVYGIQPGSHQAYKLPGAAVKVVYPAKEGSGWSTLNLNAATGSFKQTFRPRFKDVTIYAEASKPGYAASGSTAVTFDELYKHVDLTLTKLEEPEVDLTVTVYQESGYHYRQPVSGAVVNVDAGRQRVATAYTDIAGQAEFNGLTPGVYSVSATKGTASEKVGPVRLDPPSESVTIVLKEEHHPPVPPPIPHNDVDLTVHVYQQSGYHRQPASGVRVTIRGPESASPEYTDSDGEAEFDDLQPGTYYITATKGRLGKTEGPVRLTPPRQEVTILFGGSPQPIPPWDHHDDDDDHHHQPHFPPSRPRGDER